LAKCKECGEQVTWATIENGKYADKKRPFDSVGSEKGTFGLRDSGRKEEAPWGDMLPVIVAHQYDDTVSGLEHHEELHTNHFDTCGKFSFKGGSGGPKGGDRVFVCVQVGSDDYSGYLAKTDRSNESTDDEPEF
jgi:hypothetical protein